MKKMLGVFLLFAVFLSLGNLSTAGTKEDNLLVNDDRVFALSNKYTSMLSALYEEEVAAIGMDLYNYDVSISKHNARNEGEKVKALDSLSKTLNDIRPNSLSAFAQADYYTLKELIGLKYFDIKNKNKLELDALWYLEPLNTVYEVLLKNTLPMQKRIDYSLRLLEIMPETLKEAQANIKNPADLNLKLAIEKIDLEIGAIPGLTELISKISEDKTIKNQFNQATKNLEKALLQYKTFLQNKLGDPNNGDFRIGKKDYEYLYKKVYMLSGYGSLKSTLKNNLDRAQKSLLEGIAQQVIASLNEEELDERFLNGQVAVYPQDYYLLYEQYKDAPENNKILNAYSDKIMATDQFFVDNKLFPTLSLPIVITPAPSLFKERPSKITVFPPIPLAQKPTGEILITVPQITKVSKVTGKTGKKNKTTKIIQEKDEKYYKDYNYGKIKFNTAEFITPGQLLIYSIEPANASLLYKLSNDIFYIHGWIKYALDTAYENGFFDKEEDELNYLWFNYKKAIYATVDYKLQTKELDFDSALDYIIEAGIKEEEAKTYLNYLALNPFEAVSYIVGAKEFERLQKKYKKKLGKDFDLVTFHTKVLSLGRIPMIGLEKSLAKAYAKKDVDSYFTLTYF